MRKGINAWTLPRPVSWAEAAPRVRAAGFETVEPTLEVSGETAITTPEADCRQVAETIRAAGLAISSLACGLFWETHYTSPDPAVRARARELTIACLDRAMWMGAPVLLVVPGVVVHPRTKAFICPYQDALRYALEALQDLKFEAERRGVIIALENVWNGFLMSPVEMREFLDRVNSCWVGAYLDPGNVLRYGVPEDWVRTLGRRIARVHAKDYDTARDGREGFCPLGEGSVNWRAVLLALRETGYDGPLTFEGAAALEDASRRMDAILSNGRDSQETRS